MMYILPGTNLVILDCCDSIDAASADEVVPSSCMLETFCHLISDHRIHHVAINEVVPIQVFIN